MDVWYNVLAWSAVIDVPVTAEHVVSATKLAHFINTLERLDLIDEFDEQWMMQAIVAIRVAHLEQKCEAITQAMKKQNDEVNKSTAIFTSSRR